MKFVTEAIYVKRKQKHQTEKEMYCTGLAKISSQRNFQ